MGSSGRSHPVGKQKVLTQARNSHSKVHQFVCARQSLVELLSALCRDTQGTYRVMCSSFHSVLLQIGVRLYAGTMLNLWHELHVCRSRCPYELTNLLSILAPRLSLFNTLKPCKVMNGFPRMLGTADILLLA